MKQYRSYQYPWILPVLFGLIASVASPLYGQTADPLGDQPVDPFSPHVISRPEPRVKSELIIERVEPTDNPDAPSIEERIEAALREKTTIDAYEWPLTDIIEDLSKKHKIPIRIDLRTFQEEGIDPTMPILQTFDGISLGAALKLMLGEHGLEYVIKRESLMITSNYEAKYQLSTRVYEITDLHVATDYVSAPEYDGIVSIEDAITGTIKPQTWTRFGGWGTVSLQPVAEGLVLVISQRREIHKAITALLRALRKVNAHNEEGEKKPKLYYDVSTLSPEARAAERRIAEVLKQPVTLNVIEEKLSEVLKQIGKTYKIPVHIDEQEVEFVGTDPATPVTCSYEKISLGAALGLISDRHELAYTINHESLIITGAVEVNFCNLRTRVYDVTDLVRFETEEGKSFVDIETLKNTIRYSLDPKARRFIPNDGPGTIEMVQLPRRVAMVVDQSPAVQQQIVKLLATLRSVNEKEKGDTPYYHAKPEPPADPPEGKAAGRERKIPAPMTESGGMF